MDTTMEPKQEVLAQVKKRIMVMSGKGGVGKSTATVNLAYGLALLGQKVGILDADLHGPSIAHMTGVGDKRNQASATGKIMPVRVHDNLYVMSIATLLDDPDAAVIWRGPAKMGALKTLIEDAEWPELDYLIVDCPPGTGDEPLSVFQLLKKVDGAVIVTTAQDISLLDVRKSLNFTNQLGIEILGLVENMSTIVCPHCNQIFPLYQGEGIGKALVDFGIDLLGTLPFDSRISQTCDAGRPYIYDYAKTPAGEEMTKIAEKVFAKTN